MFTCSGHGKSNNCRVANREAEQLTSLDLAERIESSKQQPFSSNTSKWFHESEARGFH